MNEIISKRTKEDFQKKPLEPTSASDTTDIYSPNDYEKKLIKETYDRFYELQRAKRNVAHGIDIEEVWDENEKQVDSYLEDTSDDERSNLFIPITHSTIDSIMSEWIRQHTTGRVTPSEDPEDAPKAEIVDLCRKYVENKNNVKKIDMDTHYNTVVLGNGIQKIYYKEGYRKVRELSRVNDDGTCEYSEKVIAEWDDIAIEDCDLRLTFVDSNSRQPDFSDAADVIERKIVSMEDFIIEYGQHPNAKYVKAVGNTEVNEFYKRPKDISKQDVEILWWYNKTHDFLRKVANNVLLEDKPLPDDHKDLPFCGTGDIKRANSFWWKGEPELLRSLQDEINGLRSIRMTRNKLNTIKPIFAPTSGRLEEDEITADAGKIYYYQGTMPPTAIDVAGDMSGSYREEDRLKDDVASTTGIDRRLDNVSNADETATEVAVRKESTLARIAKKIYQNQIMLEQRRGYLIVALIMQYYTVPKMELVAGVDEIENYKNKPGHTVVAEGENAGIYKEKYRKIRVDNKKIEVKPELDGAGKVKNVGINIKDQKGYTFFDAKPEIIKGKYDYVIVPDTDMAITKAQKVEMSNMLYDRLAGNPVINSPDGKMHIPGPNGQDIAMPMPKGIVKLTENILKEHGYNIEDYLPDSMENDPMLEQAMKENMVMMQGTPLGPTPLASPDHTMVHNKWMESNIDQSMPEVRDMFNQHITGELNFQEQIAKKQTPGPSGMPTSIPAAQSGMANGLAGK